jgi:dihydroxyacetone kinase
MANNDYDVEPGSSVCCVINSHGNTRQSELFNIYRYVDQMKGEEMGLTCNTRVRDENLNRQ